MHYDLVRHDNIVFVCGGNNPDDARSRFLKIAPEHLEEYDLFTPENALENLWRDRDGPFELTAFEELIAEVSAVIVIFPESPGSFCEVGYFVAKENIISKTLLAINKDFQRFDSFISTGPANLINAHSHFRPTAYIDYQGDFTEITDRIKKRRPEKNHIDIRVENYSDLDFVQKLGIVQQVVSLLTLATREDIIYIFRSIFSSHISTKEINGLISILHGSGYLIKHDQYGHLRLNPLKKSFLKIRTGSKRLETEVFFETAEAIQESDEFSQLTNEVHDAA